MGEIGHQVAKASPHLTLPVCGRFCASATRSSGEHGFLAAGGDSQNDMVEHLRCANIDDRYTWIKRTG